MANVSRSHSRFNRYKPHLIVSKPSPRRRNNRLLPVRRVDCEAAGRPNQRAL